ncbi:flavin reductase family protein [Aquibium oceanicum]|nr:flavin reductase family protein [Aquibium oceanicum]
MSSPRPGRPDAKGRRAPKRPDGGTARHGGDGHLPAVGEREFKSAMRQVASAVFVLTARSGEEANGLTAASLCPVSTEPPLVLVSLNRDSAAERLIAESGAFAINFLTEEQHRIARLFTGTEATPEERFAEGGWDRLVTGAPVLDGALATFDCQVEKQISHGTHTIVFGRVVAALSLDEEGLIWRDGSFRRLAPVV